MTNENHKEQIDNETLQRLREMQIRMSVIVYDRRTVRNLIHEIKEGYPFRSEDFMALLVAAHRHLEVSEKFEEAEEQAKQNALHGQSLAQELNPLLLQAYESWNRWHFAHTKLMQ